MTATRSSHWLVIFDDPDQGTTTFETEAEARAFYDIAVVSWNCALYAPAAALDAYRRALDGLPEGALDGGWTWKGLDAYATRMEQRLSQMSADISRTLNEGKTMYPKIAYIFDALISRYAAAAKEQK